MGTKMTSAYDSGSRETGTAKLEHGTVYRAGEAINQRLDKGPAIFSLTGGFWAAC